MKAMRPRDIADCVGHYLQEGDLEGIVSMFHPECRLVFPRGAAPRTGHAAVRESFAMFLDQRPKLVSRVTGEIIGGDTALLTADWQIQDTQGNVMDQGTSAEVAKQAADGSWQYFLDCPFGPPAPETP